RAANEHQAGLARRLRRARVRVHDAHGDTRERMADFATLAADLAEARGTKVVRVHRHSRGAFGAAVAFERSNAKMLFERGSQTDGQFFWAGHHDARAAKMLRA